MNQIPYEEREKVYTNALVTYGEKMQMVVALEELSECQKEICKFLRGLGNAGNLAEEIADATICLEQMRIIFGLNDIVCQKMDEKVKRLHELIQEYYEDPVVGDAHLMRRLEQLGFLIKDGKMLSAVDENGEPVPIQKLKEDV